MIQGLDIASRANPFQVGNGRAPEVNQRTLEGANIALKALINVANLADVSPVSCLKDARKAVNCVLGFKNVLSGVMAKGLSPSRLIGSDQDKAVWVTSLNAAAHLMIDPVVLLAEYSSSIGNFSITSEMQRSIGLCYGSLKALKVYAGLGGAMEAVDESVNPNTLLKFAKASLDLGAFIAGANGNSDLKAGLNLISTGLSAYKLYQDSLRHDNRL